MDRRAFLIGTGSVILLARPSIAVPSNYTRALANVLVHEGGYSNHPSDPGGVTLHGVIQRRYNQYRRDRGLSIKALTRAMARDPGWIRERDEIYKIYYANPCGFDALPMGLDYSVFDYGVNSGIGRAPKVLQRVLGVPVTGRIDATTLAEVKRRGAVPLIRAVNDERMRFLRNLSTFRVFGPGWTRRVNSVRAISITMAGGSFRGDPSMLRPALGPGKAYGADDDEVMP